jgi:hypothetical protein
MLSAYVFIQTEVGKVAHVAQAISDLDGVQLAEDVAGHCCIWRSALSAPSTGGWNASHWPSNPPL